MKLNVKAMALAVGLIWGVLGMLLVGVANMIWAGYGQAFLDLMASIYPGYHASGGLGQVVVGSLYGIADGAVGGAVFAWLYNALVGRAPV